MGEADETKVLVNGSIINNTQQVIDWLASEGKRRYFDADYQQRIAELMVEAVRDLNEVLAR